ncbi:MAG: hypothetical protein KDK30_07725 [Leptospiraceae bacterium]|nr:hypothetical protein [Leptospiraceae bacterium]
MKTFCMRLVCVVLLCGLTAGLYSQAELPGDNARVNYEMAFTYLLKTPPDYERARGHLENATVAGGAYADRARLELVRLVAAEERPADQSPVAEIRQILNALEDRTQVAAVWFAAVQALDENDHVADAISMGLELSLRFPESAVADESLYLIATRLYEQRSYSASLELLYRIEDQYPDGEVADDALILRSRIYLEQGPLYSPLKGCSALEDFMRSDERPAFDQSLWRIEAARMFHENCGYAGY